MAQKKIAAVVNPFDAIAQTVKPSGKSDKPTAKVTATIKEIVDRVISSKATIKTEEALLVEDEAEIVTCVRPQQDADARAGKFSKSYSVPGNKGTLTYVTANKWSLPKDAASQAALKKLLGKRYDLWFSPKRTIGIKPALGLDPVFTAKLVTACTAVGISIEESFEVFDTLVACEDLDKLQFELSAKDLEVFRSLVRQNKPSLK